MLRWPAGMGCPARRCMAGWAGTQGEGLAGLADHSHRPLHQPRQLDPELEALVCQLRGTHPRGSAAVAIRAG